MASSNLNVKLIQDLASLMNHCCQCHVQHHHDDNQHQKSYIIRHVKSSLVLDASDYKVKLQPFTGSTAQQWSLECAERGRFIIVNKKKGYALDIEGGVEEYANIITYMKHGHVNQQWFINSDSTIECSEDSLVLEIAKSVSESEYSAGTKIIAGPKSDGENQQFLLQHA